MIKELHIFIAVLGREGAGQCNVCHENYFTMESKEVSLTNYITCEQGLRETGNMH